MIMPEGPEVKLSADLIRPLVIGKQVRKINLGGSSRYARTPPEGWKEFHNSFREEGIVNIVNECKVVDVQVKGKFMYWTFSNGWYMFSTFGMSGQWSPKAGKHVCLEIPLIDCQTNELSNVYFNDPRHFGTLKFTNSSKELDKKLQELGWDPLAMPLDKNMRWLTFQLSKSKKSIAEVLMDQGLFSGVGNYIRAEALYLSKLSPWRQANKLSQDEIKTLGQAIVDVMQESYQHQGATIHTYKTAYGEEGKYSTLFKVYGQKKDPMGRKIVTQQTPDKRTIHWCPEIQV
jgi:formamidopyrimidine-DNA glycosylase